MNPEIRYGDPQTPHSNNDAEGYAQAEIHNKLTELFLGHGYQFKGVYASNEVESNNKALFFYAPLEFQKTGPRKISIDVPQRAWNNTDLEKICDELTSELHIQRRKDNHIRTKAIEDKKKKRYSNL